MEACPLEAFNSMLSAANCGLALTPVAKSRAASAYDVICMQSEDLSAPTARSADEFQKDSAGPHLNGNHADLGRDRCALIQLERHRDTV
jgi:hypothetical protein